MDTTLPDKCVLQALQDARALIDNPSNWTQNTFARNAEGEEVTSIDPDATCWCAVGALRKTARDTTNMFYALTKARNVLSETAGRAIEKFNDSATHEEVLRVYDQAIVNQTVSRY